MRKEKLKKSLSEVKWTEFISLLGYQNIQKTCFLLFFFERIFRLICVTEITYEKYHWGRCIMWQMVWNRFKWPFTKRWDQKTTNCKFWFCNKFHLLFHSHCLIGVMVLFDKIQFTPCLSPFWFIFFHSDVARAIELLEKLQESGEVPVHKLQSLKKVLQSEFCTAIREVWD